MNRSLMSICEDEAERIQDWVERDKDSLFARLIRSSTSSDQPFLRKCDRITLSKVPTGIELPQNTSSPNKLKQVKKTPLNLASLSSISDKIALNTHCSISQKGAFLLAKGDGSPDFSSGRVVKNWELKGHFYAFKKIKSFAVQQKRETRNHHIISISSSKTKHPQSENQELWEEMIRSKENRLFHIGRGIKFLVD